MHLQYLPTSDFVLRIRAEAAGGLAATNTLDIPVHVRHTWWKNRGLWALGTLLLLSGVGSYAWRNHRRGLR